MTKNRDLDLDGGHSWEHQDSRDPRGPHAPWTPVVDQDTGRVRHWICACGKVIEEPGEHPQQSLEEMIEEVVHATREFLKSPVSPEEDPAGAELRRNLQAAIDEYDRGEP